MANASNFWVVGRHGRWVIKREGSSRAVSVHDSKNQAWITARQCAEEGRLAAILQGIDGKVVEVENFGPPETVQLIEVADE